MQRWRIGVPVLVSVVCVAMAGGVRGADEAEKTTLDNLKAAFNGESNAKVRYVAFAAKAGEEGYKSVAALFRAAADSEAIHARNFGNTLKKMGVEAKATMEKPVVKSTKENLEAALTGETAEKDSMYPAFIKRAESDKDSGAAMGFRGTVAAETEHAKFFKEALAKMDDWKAAGKEFGVCQVCGFTVMGPPPVKCPICAAPRDKFQVFK